MNKSIIDKVDRILNSGDVKITLKTNNCIHFNVRGDSDVYSVIFKKNYNLDKAWSCDCKAFSLHSNMFCSHILTAIKFLSKNNHLSK